MLYCFTKATRETGYLSLIILYGLLVLKQFKGLRVSKDPIHVRLGAKVPNVRVQDLWCKDETKLQKLQRSKR